MFTKKMIYGIKNTKIPFFSLFVLLFLFLSACTNLPQKSTAPSSETQDGHTAPLTNHLVSATSDTAPTPGEQAFTQIFLHLPVGRVTMTWTRAIGKLTVVVTASGLAANSTHPVHIHEGNTCDRATFGAVRYMLPPLVTDASGTGKSVTTIPGIKNGIPSSGWTVIVHNGPSMATSLQSRAIACAPVTNIQADGQGNQTTQNSLSGTGSPDENVSGQLIIKATASTSPNFNLVAKEIDISLRGLAPHSTHVAELRFNATVTGVVGDARFQLLSKLQPVTVGPDGTGTSKTVFPSGLPVPVGAMYVVVREGGPCDNVQLQQFSNPLALSA
jgi:hypothetical protein